VEWTQEYTQTLGDNYQAVELITSDLYIYALWSFEDNQNAKWIMQRFSLNGELLNTIYSNAMLSEKAMGAEKMKDRIYWFGQTNINGKDKLFIHWADTSLVNQNLIVSGWDAAYDDQFADALMIAENSIVLAFNSQTDSSGSDITIFRQSDIAEDNWSFHYNGLSNSDDKVTAIAASGKYIFAAGQTRKIESGIAHDDYLLLCLREDGQLLWEAHYDGPQGLLNDAQLAVNVDVLDRIWISGSSNNGVSNDIFTAVYDTIGTLLFEHRFEQSGDKDEAPVKIERDRNAGIFIKGTAEKDSSEHVVIRYGDNNREQQIIENQLKILAVSLMLPMQDTIIKNIVWKYVEKSFTDLWYVFIDEIVQDAMNLDYPIISEMNKSVIQHFKWPAKDYVTPLLKKFYYDGRKYRPFIYVVQADSLTKQYFMDSIPIIAYSHLRETYPVPAVKFGKDDFEYNEIDPIHNPSELPYIPWKKPVLQVAIHPDNWVRNSYKRILVNCFSRLPENCLFCFSGNENVNYSQTGSSHGHNEIVININNLNALCYDDDAVEYIFNSDNETSLLISGENTPVSSFGNPFAIIEKVDGNYSFYRRIRGPGENVRLKKHIYPFQFKKPNINLKEGNTLTLCKEINIFKDLGEYYYSFIENQGNNNSEIFGMAMGGIYKIHLPHTNATPLYFAYPYLKGLWFDDPDMKFSFFQEAINSTQYCHLENGLSNQDNYSYSSSAFMNFFQDIYSPVDNLPQKYVLNKDLNILKEYWAKNHIKVFFNVSSNSKVKLSNLVQFSPLEEGEIFNANPHLITSFNLNPLGEYEVLKTLSSPLNANDELQIIVKANFRNGDIINNVCKTFILNSFTQDNLTYSQFNFVGVEFTGDLKNFSNEEINYKIEIWKKN